MADGELRARPRGPLGNLLGRLGLTRVVLDSRQRHDIERALYERGRLRGSMTRNFVVLSALSSVIAALGLVLDSAPAVIGAMLLGPFIIPLLAIAGSLVQGRGRPLANALVFTLLGICLSVASATLVGTLVRRRFSTDELPSLLAALTRPGLPDLAIALTAGVAAGYATLRTEAGGALSGVAVSVTIEPPLAAMGLFLAAGNHAALRQVTLAMVTNFGALVVGATAAMAWWGFADRARRREKGRTAARVAVVVWLAAVAAIAVPLAAYSRQVLADQRFEQDVSEQVAEWDASVRITSLDARVRGSNATVDLSIAGPRQPEPAWRLAELMSERQGVKVTVNVVFVLSAEDTAVATP